MADEFSFTDSDDERDVEDVLSQALDHSVLEQIAAINCSSISSKNNLPFDLENRFRKLKSLPTATTAAGARFPPSKSKSFTPRSGADSVDFERVSDLKNCSDKPSPFTGDPKQHSDEEEYSDEKKGSNSRSKLKSDTNSKDFRKTRRLKSKSKTDSSESSPSSDDSEQHSDGNLDEKIGTNSRSKPKSSSNSKQFRKTKSLNSKSRNDSSESSLEHSDGNLDEKIGTNSRSKLKLSSNSRKTKSLKSKSRTNSWSVSSPESESRSVSPARRGIGCLWCSPKKEKRKQGKENRLSSFSSSLGNEYEYDVEFLKTFSTKEQKKIMRKAMKEEEKINREAEKIVKWAKQASSRMMDVDVSGVVDDELSDVEK